MDNRWKNIIGDEREVRVIICNIRSEIDLDGLELLKLEIDRPGASVLCTAGTLWLTQPGDPHDHLLKAGQSFSLNQRGAVLVQGLPCGKAAILDRVKEPLSRKSRCAGQWDPSLEAE